MSDPRYTDLDTVADGSSDIAGCDRCGEGDISPNVEAYELSGEIVCNDCAEQIFRENGPGDFAVWVNS